MYCLTKSASAMSSKDGQIWKAITRFDAWPMTSNFSWTEGKIDFEFHSGTDPLKPTMAITNKNTTLTLKLELKLHFINATDSSLLQTIPESKIILKPKGHYVSFTRWNKIQTIEPVIVLVVVQAFQVQPDQMIESTIKAHEDILLGSQPPVEEPCHDKISKESSLSGTLQMEWQKQEMSDFTVISNDNMCFQVNRVILALRSKVLKAMFFGSFQKPNQNFLTMDGIVLRSFLEFMYTDQISEKLSDESIFDLLSHAHLYDVPELLEFCLCQIHQRINEKSLKLSPTGLIILFRLDKLSKSHMDYIRCNLFESFSQPEWKEVQKMPELLKIVRQFTFGDPEWLYFQNTQQ